MKKGRDSIFNNALVKCQTIADIGCDARRMVLSFLGVKDLYVTRYVSTKFKEPAQHWIKNWIEASLNPKLTNTQHLDNELLLETIVRGSNNDILMSERSYGSTRGAVDSITRGSLRRLDPGKWLNDEVINYYFRHALTNRDEEQCLLTDEDRGRQGFYNTFFIQILFNKKNSNLRLRNKYN